MPRVASEPRSTATVEAVFLRPSKVTVGPFQHLNVAPDGANSAVGFCSVLSRARMARPVRPEEGDSMNAFECRTSRTATLGSAVPGILQNPNEWRRWGAAALVSLIIAAALGISAARAGATTTDALAEVN